MSLSHLLPAIAISPTACGDYEPDSIPARVNKGLIRQPTTSHPPSFPVAALGRLQQKSMRKHVSKRSISRLSPVLHERPTEPPIALEEYAALPPTLRKKCFSSVERLRIAQQITTSDTVPHTSCDLSADRISQDTAGDSVRSAVRPSSEANSSSPPPLHSSPPTSRTPVQLHARQSYISADQALWFLTLPDKIRRQQFESEERTQLTERCESILNHAAPEWTLPRNSSSTSRSLSRPSVDQLSKLDDGNKDELAGPSDTDTATLASLRTLERLYVGRVRYPTSIESQRPSPTTEPAHASDDATAPASPIEALPQVPPQRSRSISRISSLTPMALPPIILAKNHHRNDYGLRHGRAMSYSDVPSRPRQFPSMPELPVSLSAPSFYHDHQTRSKLRRYVLSPEKFDEAVEFGFPTTSATENAQSVQRSPNTLSGTPIDETLQPSAVFDSDVEEDRPSLDMREPLTPDPTTHVLGFPRKPSSESAELTPDTTRFLHEPSPQTKCSTTPTSNFDALVNREMTLRITLTRPELRDLDGSTPRQISSESNWDASRGAGMAIEALPIFDESAEAHGGFLMKEPAASRKSLSRMLRSLRRHG